MDIVLLPGNDRSHKTWVDALDLEVRPMFTRTIVHYYDHWWKEGEELLLDIDSELERLSIELEQSDRYMVFAKSAGVALALYGMYEGMLDPEVCVFAGTPVPWARERGFALDTWFVNYSVPSLFIQQKEDPAFSAIALEAYLTEKNVSNHFFRAIEGSDHLYRNTDELIELMKEFVDL
jgi:hypothetical protein